MIKLLRGIFWEKGRTISGLKAYGFQPYNKFGQNTGIQKGIWKETKES